MRKYEKVKIFKKYIIPVFFLFLFFVMVFLPLCAKAQLWIDEVLDSDPAYNLAFHRKMVLGVWEGIENVEEHFFR